MTHTTSATVSRQVTNPSFADPDGLRTLLERLDRAGPGAWRDDPEAAGLMRFVTDRYAALARKHHAEPADAAVAAFEAMLNRSTRTADDPWAVVTTAVRITLIADERAHGLLTSTERARRPQYSTFHDVTRFGDQDTDLADYHPALQTTDVTDSVVEPDDGRDVDGAGDVGEASGDQHDRVVEDVVALLSMLDWPEQAARLGIEYICARLVEIGDRHHAYERLRRDKTIRAQLDWPHESWIGLLRLVLGHPTASNPATRRGLLVRLLIGENVAGLLTDDELILAVDRANPHPRYTAAPGGASDG